jgi:hypothetical protein
MTGSGEKVPQPRAPNVEFVDLAERDLADKVGAFRMKATRMIWRVSADQGQLAVTDHLGVTCRWRGLSPTRFRSPACPSRNDATLVFERGSPERLFGMRLEEGDGSNLVFEPIQLATPDAAQLAGYVGRYHNDELQATYSFSVRDGGLFLQVNNHRHERLSPTVADEFMPHLRTPDDGRIVTFVRDANKRVTGFVIDLWRIKGMRFKKLAETSN